MAIYQEPEGLIRSREIFEQMCDLLGVSENERKNMISLDVHLERDQLVTYKLERYATKEQDNGDTRS